MPKIHIVRDQTVSRDFRVLIDGEHRATFRSRKRFSMIGYDFEAPDGKSIHEPKRSFGRDVFKTEFAEHVNKCLPNIPTRAQIDRSLLIDQAQKENRERDDAISRHRAQVRNEVYSVALARYLDNPASAEHADMAVTMLRQHHRDW